MIKKEDLETYNKINEINGIIVRLDPKLSEARKAFQIIDDLGSTISDQRQKIQELKQKIKSLEKEE